MNAGGGRWPDFRRCFSNQVEERLGKTIHSSPCCLLSLSRDGIRQLAEAKFRVVLPCFGVSIADSRFRGGR